jgi:hypothetical protein
VLPFKKPSKYFSFCDTVFGSWGRSGRICYLPYCFIPKRKKKALLHGMWMLVGTRWNRLAMVCERKKMVRRSAKLYKRAPKCQSLSKTCLLFVWKIVKTLLSVIDKDNHLSKPNFYLSVLQIKSSSTCLITASLCEGPFFYFYVESPPSTFMHHLREYSCHSEFNVYSSKVYHWLIYNCGFTFS